MATISLKRPEGVVRLVTDGDLYAEFSAAMEEVNKNLQASVQDGRMNSGTKSAAKKVDDLQKQMAATSVYFKLRGMPRGEWKALKAEHPARPDNHEDAELGANLDAICEVGIPKSIVSATFDNDEVAEYDWAELSEEMTDSQYMDFVYMFLALNGGDAGVPFSVPVSQLAQS